jgi:hypothetical protein
MHTRGIRSYGTYGVFLSIGVCQIPPAAKRQIKLHDYQAAIQLRLRQAFCSVYNWI